MGSLLVALCTLMTAAMVGMSAWMASVAQQAAALNARLVSACADLVVLRGCDWSWALWPTGVNATWYTCLSNSMCVASWHDAACPTPQVRVLVDSAASASFMACAQDAPTPTVLAVVVGVGAVALACLAVKAHRSTPFAAVDEPPVV
jgi:hypothetical protein